MADKSVYDVLEMWKTRRFRATDLLLQEAAESLSDKKPLIDVRPGLSSNKWAVFNTQTKKIANLVHPLIWDSGYSLETGNYVPKDETSPIGLKDKDIVRELSWKCEYSFSFETMEDDSIHDHFTAIEDFGATKPNFNIGKHPRREWQNGRSEISRRKFIAASPIFVTRTPYNCKEDGSYTLPYEPHPWITDLVKSQKTHIPNPQKPGFYDYTDNKITKLENCGNPKFHRGDVVLVTFRLGFVFPARPWHTEMIPLEIIRVASTTDAPGAADSAAYPRETLEMLELNSVFFPIDSATPGNAATDQQKRQRSRTLSGVSHRSIEGPSKKKQHTADADMMDIEDERPTIAAVAEQLTEKGDSRAVVDKGRTTRSGTRGHTVDPNL